MATRAKLTLAASCVFTVSTIYVVHYMQRSQKEQMALGVEKDDERLKKKRKQEQNVLELQTQIALQQELEKTQRVSQKA
ncbi:hypothetical protein BC938DRAFT_472759 [Jimgerdemannia flammicorona]|uniref:Cytochrome c oxidase assembly protein n=2 Tax=Jimgerdemannia flammicorona TaxID=994334 RepID=A0A433Q5F6_9FUNG|nr:hypothetical protein BC938DRAFT_472759 [Jimgerdemannia flammicorona]